MAITARGYGFGRYPETHTRNKILKQILLFASVRVQKRLHLLCMGRPKKSSWFFLSFSFPSFYGAPTSFILLFSFFSLVFLYIFFVVLSLLSLFFSYSFWEIITSTCLLVSLTAIWAIYQNCFFMDWVDTINSSMRFGVENLYMEWIST